jgi:hypothetical protein
MSRCKTNGAHTLPAGEESWSDADADYLVAASWEACQPCSYAMIERVAAVWPSETFGKLFTTWVLQNMNLQMMLGGRIPRTGVDLCSPGTLAIMSRQMGDALRAVTFEALAQDGMDIAVSMPSVPEQVFADMSRADRKAVLNDVLDGIVGAMDARRSPAGDVLAHYRAGLADLARNDREG